MRYTLYFLCLLPSALLSSHPGSCLQAEEPRHLVFMIAEREYKTEKTLPDFYKKHAAAYSASFVSAKPDDPNTFNDIQSIKKADVLILSVRRRTPPKEQLDYIRNHVKTGKPVIGIRTANHAFCLRNKPPPDGLDAWPDFDADVFGGNYTNHYGKELAVQLRIPPDLHATCKQLLNGTEERFPCRAGGSLYCVSPLKRETHVLINGVVENQTPEPVAWTFRRPNGGKSFYTSLGHIDDFHGPVLPKLLINAISWCLAD